MEWNKLSMADKARYIQLGVENGITNLNDIRESYNIFAGGGPTATPDIVPQQVLKEYIEAEQNKQEEFRNKLALQPTKPIESFNQEPWQEAVSDVMSYLPYIGTVMDIDNTIQNPSWENGAYATFSFLSDLFSAGLIKSGAKAVKAAKASRNKNLLRASKRPLDEIPPEYILGAGLYGNDALVNTIQNDRNKKSKFDEGGELDSEEPIWLKELIVTGKKPSWTQRNILNPLERFAEELKNNPITGPTRRKLQSEHPTATYLAGNGILEDILRPLSDVIMETSRKVSHNSDNIKGTRKRDPNTGESNLSTAQETYLLPRDMQRNIFLNTGYTEGTSGDYGRVRGAVGDRNLPVYQKYPDDDNITRDDLVTIANYGADTNLSGASLTHAGSYPKALYLNKNTGKFYEKGWDLNDYGGTGGGTSSKYNPIHLGMANLLDYVGSPTVVTTGFKNVDKDKVLELLNTNEDAFNRISKEGTDIYNRYNESKKLEQLSEFLNWAESVGIPTKDLLNVEYQNINNYNDYILYGNGVSPLTDKGREYLNKFIEGINPLNNKNKK